VSIHSPIESSSEFVFTVFSTQLRGWVRRRLAEGLLDQFVRDPDRYFNADSQGLIKQARKTQIARATLRSANGASLDVVIKKFRYRFPRRLGFFAASSPAYRSLAGALLLLRKGFHTPAPVAVLERRGWRHTGTSYYIAEELKGSSTLQELWRAHFASQPAKRRLLLGRAAVGDLAQLLHRLHRMGIYHRDLKSSNILVRDWDSERRAFFIVDLDRVQKRRRIPVSKTLKNLLQVRNSTWSRRERIRFFSSYAELSGMTRPEGKRFVRKLLSSHVKRRR